MTPFALSHEDPYDKAFLSIDSGWYYLPEKLRFSSKLINSEGVFEVQLAEGKKA